MDNEHSFDVKSERRQTMRSDPDFRSADFLCDPRIEVTLNNHAGETLLDAAIKATQTLPPEAGLWIYSVISNIGSHPSASQEIRQRAEEALNGWRKKVKRSIRELVNRCGGEVPKNHDTQTVNRMVVTC